MKSKTLALDSMQTTCRTSALVEHGHLEACHNTRSLVRWDSFNEKN